MKQPYEDVVGVDRADSWMLFLDRGAMAHRDALIAMTKHLRDACMVGRPAPIVERMAERLRSPRLGDLVVEVTTALRFGASREIGNSDETRLKGFGYLLERRREWWSTDEQWEAEKAAEGWGDDEERLTYEAWYVQYGPKPRDVCRWVNCDFVVVPTDPFEFDITFGARDDRGVTVTRADLLGALADSGIKLRTVAREEVPAAEHELTLGMWHLLQSMLQDRIRQAEEDGIGPDDPSSQYRADLSRRLLWHEMRAREHEATAEEVSGG